MSFGAMSGGEDPITGDEITEYNYNGLNSEIVEDLITLAGLTPNVVPTENIVIEEYKCIHAVIYERILSLLKSVDYQLRYDPELRVLNYEPRGYINNGLTLSKKDFIGLPKWSETRDGLINNLRIDGATVETQITEKGQIGVTEGYTENGIKLTKTPNIVELYMDNSNPPTTQRLGGTKDASTNHYYWIDRESQIIMPKEGTKFTNNHYAIINYSWSAPTPIQDFNALSIAKYGEAEEVFTFNDITSIADAETRLGKILDTRSEPFKVGTLLIKRDIDIQVGELVYIDDTLSYTPVTGQFVVTKVVRKYPTGYLEIQVGDKQWKLEDDIIELENRVKRLEEQFIRNQDRLLQLLRIENDAWENAKIPSERYIKIFKNQITGYDVTVLDNPEYGELDKCALDDADLETDIPIYVTTYGLYVENIDFTDPTSDFKDENSEAWLLYPDKDKDVLSSYITLNEKVITNCEFKSRIFGDIVGTEFYLDNGNGWELLDLEIEVEDNPSYKKIYCNHTFVSDGNYIRWKAIETAGKNISINYVKIKY